MTEPMSGHMLCNAAVAPARTQCTNDNAHLWIIKLMSHGWAGQVGAPVAGILIMG